MINNIITCNDDLVKEVEATHPDGVIRINDRLAIELLATGLGDVVIGILLDGKRTQSGSSGNVDAVKGAVKEINRLIQETSA